MVKKKPHVRPVTAGKASHDQQIISNHPLAGVSCPKGTKIFKDQFSYLKERQVHNSVNARPAQRRGRVKYLRRHSKQKDTAPTSTQGRSADWDPSPSQLGQCSQRHTFGENVFSDLTISSLITSKKNSSILKNFQNHSLEASIYMTTCLSPSCSTFPGFNPAIEIRPSPVLGKESGGQLRLGG